MKYIQIEDLSSRPSYFREAMTAFAGGQRSGGMNQNRWTQKYQTMRADKLKDTVVDGTQTQTGNISRTQRPGAFSMMKNFYSGYKDVRFTI